MPRDTKKKRHIISTVRTIATKSDPYVVRLSAKMERTLLFPSGGHLTINRQATSTNFQMSFDEEGARVPGCASARVSRDSRRVFFEWICASGWYIVCGSRILNADRRERPECVCAMLHFAHIIRRHGSIVINATCIVLLQT